MKNYIGISSSHHDSAMAIVNPKGEVVFAESTERYLQNKRALNMAPDIAHRTLDLINTYCDPGSEIVVAYTWSGDSVIKWAQEQLAMIRQVKAEHGEKLSPLHLNHLSFFEGMGHFQIQALNATGLRLADELNRSPKWSGKKVETRKYNHHLTHAATACFTSPYEEGVCVVVDGYGEGRSNDLFVYRDGKIKNIYEPNQKAIGSLGFFYTLICEVCGFNPDKGEEWKVMGLAPYGKFDQELYKVLKTMLKVDGMWLFDGSPFAVSQAMYQLQKIRRQPQQPALSMADIAFTAQVVYEELLTEILANVAKLGISKNLILGGGCMLNSSATGKLLGKTNFESIHVYSAPGDDGNAIGAALLAYYEDHPEKKPFNGRHMSPYLGSDMSEEVLENFRRFGKGNMKSYPGEVHKKAAELLAEGKIIGWMQGRAEFGPRALGNRSILADARHARIKEEINAKVKFREEFRPFAPSILHEFGDEYFENYQTTPYMERTLRFKAAVLDKIPGVVHVDNTGRLQSVKREWNEKYYDLIEAYYKITGIPLVLNTSFNVMGKPIIHSIEDAVAVFYTTGLDALVLGDDIIVKD